MVLNLGLTSRELEALVANVQPGQFQRAHHFGSAQYIHPQQFPSGVYLPANLGEQVRNQILGDGRLVGLNGEPLTSNETEVVGLVVSHLLRGESFSGGRDYALRFITGDVGGVRTLEVDGTTQEVLVIPQGYRRATVTAQSFAKANMAAHPLANRPDKVLEVMARTMALAGFNESFYFRLTAGGDATTNGACADPVISALVQASTWQFTPVTPYHLDPFRNPKKVVMVSSQRISEREIFHLSKEEQFLLKGIGRYEDRVTNRLELLASEQAKGRGINDLAYATQNGLVVDTTFTNLAYVGAHPDKDGWLMMAMPISSEGNAFFEGKTQATMYELLEMFGREYCIEVRRVHSPEELASAFGYQNRSSLTGLKLTNAVVLDKVEGMLGPGTFLGPQVIFGYAPSLAEQKRFEYQGRIKEATSAVIDLYNRTVWSLRGGGPEVYGTTLSADGKYCTLFDVGVLREGKKATPLDFTHLQEP